MTTPLSLTLPAGVTVLERGWLSSNMVLVTSGEEIAVVDTGYWTHSDQTVALVAQAAQGRPLAAIANTHLHSDHCGGNAALQAAHRRSRTLIPPGQAQAVHQWDPAELTYEPTGQHCPRFRADGVLQPGASVNLAGLDWQVHAAPGHDAHSVVLFHAESRTLISADALWENGFGVVFQELEGERAFEAVGATLDMIERLRPSTVIPGHGKVFGDVDGALSRARSRLDAYQACPDRHAAHAAKVLMKFKLLELQQSSRASFFHWIEATPYFRMVHDRWFAHVELQPWISGLLDDLVRSGAASKQGDQLANC